MRLASNSRTEFLPTKCASRSSFASENGGAMNVTPKGRPSSRKPAGIERLLNDGYSSRRYVRECRTSGGSGKSGHIDVVFNRERDAEERPIRRPRSKFPSPLQSSLFRNQVDPDLVVPSGLILS